MKTLIAEDDFTSRLLLQELLKPYGTCHIAVDGLEAFEAVRMALDSGDPYNLICLDIMMPELDGQEALRRIRNEEESRGILSSSGAKILMTTALDDPKNVIKAFGGLCDAYLVKPVRSDQLMQALHKLGLAE